MSSSYTNLLGLVLPVQGELEGTWGDTVNQQLTQLLDDAVANAVTLNLTAGDVTLTSLSGAADQARMAILIVTGTPGVTRTVTAPSKSKVYQVINQSDSSVVIKGAATTGVTILAGASGVVAWNGSDFIEIGAIASNRTINGVLQLSAGTATTPSLTTTGDTNTGLYFPAADTVGVAVGGVQALLIDSAGIEVPAGTAAAPSLTTTGDTNTGLYFPAADTVGVAVGGVQVAQISPNGFAVNGNNISAVNSLGFRNRIINGDMRIDQRNAGASINPTDGQFVVDRFAIGVSQTSKLTAQSSPVAPAGFTNSILVTSSSAYSVLTADYFAVNQSIEGFNVADFGWGTANAQAVTLSFWVRSSLTGTFAGSLRNSASNRSYPFSYTISAANTWEQKTVTIAGDTAGTWLTDNGAGIRVWFTLGAGSTYSGTAGAWSAGNFVSATGATSVVGTNGATFYITGVQLEAGTVATPFERRDYGRELMMCQRYYYNTGGNFIFNGGVTNYNGSQGCFTFPLPVAMRATPSLGGSIAGITSARGNSYWNSSPTFAIDTSNSNVVSFGVNLSPTRSAGICCVLDPVTSLTFSAEL